MDMSFHHRVTQSLTEFYFFDFKLIKLCDTLCYSVVNSSFIYLNLFSSCNNINRMIRQSDISVLPSELFGIAVAEGL